MSIPQQQNLHVPLSGYIALLCAIIFFSGALPVIATSIVTIDLTWLKTFDFGILSGDFGRIGEAKATFRGSGGYGAKDGFLFGLALAPPVMLALGIVEVVEHLKGLRAGQKLLTPLLRPLMGTPGIAGLALISSLQSTDAGASMTRSLKEEKLITENERTIFSMFQFSAGAPIVNILSTGSAITVLVAAYFPPIILATFGVVFFYKIVGANIMRLYLKKFGVEG